MNNTHTIAFAHEMTEKPNVGESEQKKWNQINEVIIIIINVDHYDSK